MIRKGDLEQLSLTGVNPDSCSLLSQDWRFELGKPHWHENQVLKGEQLLPISYPGKECESF